MLKADLYAFGQHNNNNNNNNNNNDNKVEKLNKYRDLARALKKNCAI